MVPGPECAQFSVPGLAFASAINSGMVFTGSEGGVITRKEIDANRLTGTKSFSRL